MPGPTVGDGTGQEGVQISTGIAVGFQVSPYLSVQLSVSQCVCCGWFCRLRLEAVEMTKKEIGGFVSSVVSVHMWIKVVM